MTDTYTPVLTDEEIAQALNDAGVTDYADVPLRYDLEIARVIERAAVEAYQRQQWLPIETAPHNEEVLLGWRDWDGAWMSEVSMASWGWRNEHVSCISKHGRATNWMPLPPAPETQS